MIVAQLHILGSSGPCDRRWGQSQRTSAEAEEHTKDRELSITEQLQKWAEALKGRLPDLGNARSRDEDEPHEHVATCDEGRTEGAASANDELEDARSFNRPGVLGARRGKTSSTARRVSEWDTVMGDA